MFKKYIFAVLLLAFISCKKDKVQPTPEQPAFIDPEMTYIDLTGKSVGWGQTLAIDFDGNKKTDLLFYTELHSVEFNTKTLRKYFVGGGVACKMAALIENETTPDLDKGAKISHTDLPNYEWHPALGFTLMQHVTAGDQTYWEGSWKDRDHRYLPFELVINGKNHLGWIELFADTKTDKLVFYRAAISKEPQTVIRAGY
ncbi:hypothetical protein [Mucilaginibacter auburnensis]|uniref:Uncharacterized protein n=1 Tax=Mucilaginibacter auburnensis TaxID=1457233 RepID=A0A2H9VSI6_9SPHI|nr:hypothetical protein [Mucilaginibacter auburnensis]PJJ83778.1 hypothetical protein CLV57_0771 [Mucilaginibacter auburnensis]